MSLLNLNDVSYSWDGDPLLEGVSLNLETGEHIGLVGRNGCGKSTLLQLLEGAIAPDRGEIHRAGNLCVRRLIQEVPDGDQQTVEEIIGKNLYFPEEELWRKDKALDRMVTQMHLDRQSPFSSLSSGMKRRALLAQAIVDQPDVLLLDEPTNHLDIESIIWLEAYLKAYPGALLFVTHDRAFLQTLASRILEVDRGQLFDWSCNYQTFLHRKETTLAAEDKQNANFDKKLAQEEVWIRKGIQARRTRNEGRVRALKKMRAERQQRRERAGNVQMQASEADRSGKLVVETKNLSFDYGGQPIVEELSTLITAGDKIGIIGPNGAGKTTLIKLLLGELQPKDGSVRHGAKLETIYFDQLREQINDELSIIENIADDRKTVTINGRTKNVYSYLEDFLFTPDLARKPAATLSGGERNRLLLAKLFQQPANLIVMDEPTNDLDAETLEVLESTLVDFTGTVLVVSHDRTFLDNVATSTIAFDGSHPREYVGGYSDYVRQTQPAVKSESKPPSTSPTPPAKRERQRTRKLTNREREELSSLPDRITTLEAERDQIHETMSHPAVYQDSARIPDLKSRLEAIEPELQEAYTRWEELDAIE